LTFDLTAFYNNPVVTALGIDTTEECAALAAGTLSTAVLNTLLDSLILVQKQCLIDAGIVLSVRG